MARLQLQHLMVDDTNGVDTTGVLRVNQGLTAGEPGSGTALSVNTEGTKASYSAAVIGVAQATAGVVWYISQPAATTKVIRVTRIVIGGVATAATLADIILQHSTAAPTGGAAVAATRLQHDSTDGAPSGLVNSATGATIFNGTVINARAEKVFLAATGTPVLEPAKEWLFGVRPAKEIVLRAANETFGILVPAIVGASYDVDIEWTEE